MREEKKKKSNAVWKTFQRNSKQSMSFLTPTTVVAGQQNNKLLLHPHAYRDDDKMLQHLQWQNFAELSIWVEDATVVR